MERGRRDLPLEFEADHVSKFIELNVDDKVKLKNSSYLSIPRSSTSCMSLIWETCMDQVKEKTHGGNQNETYKCSVETQTDAFQILCTRQCNP